MNVQAWVEKNGRGAAAALSKVTGISQPSLCKKLHFKLLWSLEDAVMLDMATDGEIRAEDVCPEYTRAIAHIRGVKT